MCDPATGLAALQGVQTFSNINNQNEQASVNASNAIDSGNSETAQTTEQFLEQHRSLIQGGFDAILEGRSAESTAYTSAIENGVQGASVKALLRNQKQLTDRSTIRTNQEIKSLKNQTGASYSHIGAKTQGRINSVAPTGFNIGDAASILSPIVKAQMD